MKPLVKRTVMIMLAILLVTSVVMCVKFPPTNTITLVIPLATNVDTFELSLTIIVFRTKTTPITG